MDFGSSSNLTESLASTLAKLAFGVNARQLGALHKSLGPRTAPAHGEDIVLIANSLVKVRRMLWWM
jgi:hypothetical protein